MKNFEEMKDEELEKVTGGAPPIRIPKTVDSPVVGYLYQSFNSTSKYAYVTGFNGHDTDMVHYLLGNMQTDGKVHVEVYTIGNNLYESRYDMFSKSFNLSVSLSGNYWAE